MDNGHLPRWNPHEPFFAIVGFIVCGIITALAALGALALVGVGWNVLMGWLGWL